MKLVSPRGRVTYYSKDDPHAIYRLIDRHERVIYIGSSHDPDARIETHWNEKKWRNEIFRWTEEWYADWSGANAAEHAAVWREDPDHNFVGTPLSAIISRARFGPDGWDAAEGIIVKARACRTRRIDAEKAGDANAAREANQEFREIAARLGVPGNRVQQIAEGRTAGGQGGGAPRVSTAPTGEE